jgi:hypothetical protein
LNQVYKHKKILMHMRGKKNEKEIENIAFPKKKMDT